MESSINLYHDKNLIETISDERLFKKQEIVENNNVVTKWVQIPNTLYKLEKSNPTSSLGVSGDYCAKYVRRYNNFKYSETFTANTTNSLWNSYYCSFNTSTNNPSFPYSPSKKMKGLTTFKKHYFQYKIDNQDVPYTFSIYAKPDEIKTFKIGLYNENFSQGVELKIAFDDEYNESHIMSYTTNHSDVTYYNIFITQVDENKHIYRVGISAKILQTPYVYARVMLIHNTMEEFKMNTDSQGMYFNAAQLTNNTASLDDYVKTYGFTKSSLTLDKLYKRGNSNWSVVQNTNLYYLSNEMEIIRVDEDEYDVKYYLDGADDIGNVGDIATITPILNINPFIRVGDNTSIKIKGNNDSIIGTIKNCNLIYRKGTNNKAYNFNDELIGNVDSNGKVNLNNETIGYVNSLGDNTRRLVYDLTDKLIGYVDKDFGYTIDKSLCFDYNGSFLGILSEDNVLYDGENILGYMDITQELIGLNYVSYFDETTIFNDKIGNVNYNNKRKKIGQIKNKTSYVAFDNSDNILGIVIENEVYNNNQKIGDVRNDNYIYNDNIVIGYIKNYKNMTVIDSFKYDSSNKALYDEKKENTIGYITNNFDNPIAYMYYNSDDGHYYIKTKKSTSVIKVSENPPINHISYSDCRLMYDDQKPDSNAIIHAILYNQQTYQHYTRCSYFGRGASHRYGIGTSGYLNFYGSPLQRNRGF